MRFKMALTGFVLALALISLSLFPAGITCADDQAGNNSEILSKLNQILDNQKSIMDQIESLRQELNIVKIRVTQAQ